MSRAPLLSLPLFSRTLPLLVGFGFLAAACAVCAQSTVTANVHVEWFAEPVIEPSTMSTARLDIEPVDHPVRRRGKRRYGQYTVRWGSLLSGNFIHGTLDGSYSHAESAGPAERCVIDLKDPRPDPKERKLDPVESPPPTQRLFVRKCSPRMAADIPNVVTELDEWLARSSVSPVPPFEATLGSSWPGLAYALLVLLGGLGLLVPLLAARVEIVPHDGSASHRMLRIGRRLGPFRKTIAEVLANEIVNVRVVARGFGPLTFYKPTLSLGKNKSIDVWPIARLGSSRAIAGRDAIVAALEKGGASAGKPTDPFRSAG